MIRSMLCSFILSFLVLSGYCPVSCADDSNQPVIRIGLGFELNLYKRDDLPSSFVSTTLDALRTALRGKYRLDITSYTTETLGHAIDGQKVDVFFAPAVLYRQRLLNGTRDLASAVSIYANNPNETMGAVILTKSTPNAPRRLDQLVGKHLGAGIDFDTDVVHMLLGEVALLHEDNPYRFFASIDRQPAQVDRLLNRLARDEVDAIVLPSCLLEAYSLRSGADTSWLQVVNAQSTGSLRCFHSTQLYPGLSVISLPSMDPAVARLFTRVLMELPPMNGMYWGVATDFSGIDRLLYRLNTDAWADWRTWSYTKLWLTFRPWILGATVILLLLVAHSLVVSYLVRKKTRQLSDALKAKEQSYAAAQRYARQLEKLQKMSTVAQMAGVFAHEIRQPLNAITCYAHGIGRFASQPNELSKITVGITGICTQAQRISEIIERVRGYVKSRSTRRQLVPVTQLIEGAIRSFQSTSEGFIPITYRMQSTSSVLCDPLEMELVLINLLRNAAEAQNKVAKPWIRIEAACTEDIEITITDNGPQITLEQFKQINTVGDSSKPEGLGLGLSIARSLVESHGGSLSLHLTDRSSLSVQIVLPSGVTQHAPSNG